MNYYLARDGQTYGPYPEESILTMLQEGQVVPEDLLCPEGESEWVSLHEIPAFAPSTPPPMPQPAASSPPGGLRISAPAPQTQAPPVRTVAAPVQTSAPARPALMERSGSVLRKLKLVGYGVGALVVVVVLIVGFIAAQRDAKEIEKLHSLPGWNAFAAGNGKIESESTEAGYGNNSEATQLSTRLASVLGMAQKENFAVEKRSSYRGRSKIGRIASAVNSTKSTEPGKFQTFVEMREDRAIVLIHVPDFKLYKGETREAMRQMCWEIARVGVTAAKKTEARLVAPPVTQPAPAARIPGRTGQRVAQTNRLARLPQTNRVARVARPASPSPAAPPPPPPDLMLVVGLRDKRKYDCVFAGNISDASVQGNTSKAAMENVPSHQLLVKWFGTENPD
jgi:hypothetical protein